MPAINTTSYRFGKSNLDAAAMPEVVALAGGEIRTLQVLVPNGTLRPIDVETGATIPLSEIRGASNEPLTEYPETDAIGEWNFSLIGYPICNLGVTGPDVGSVEKIYEFIASAQAVAEVIHALPTLVTGGFTGTVDWITQVVNKPPIAQSAGDLGAVAVTSVGAANGVAPLAAGKVPIGYLPTGSTSTTVALGSHTHVGGYDGMAAGEDIRITETAPGVYPLPPTSRGDIIRVFRGSVRPTPAQGWRDGDEWLNGQFV